MQIYVQLAEIIQVWANKLVQGSEKVSTPQNPVWLLTLGKVKWIWTSGSFPPCTHMYYKLSGSLSSFAFTTRPFRMVKGKKLAVQQLSGIFVDKWRGLARSAPRVWIFYGRDNYVVSFSPALIFLFYLVKQSVGTRQNDNIFLAPADS